MSSEASCDSPIHAILLQIGLNRAELVNENCQKISLSWNKIDVKWNYKSDPQNMRDLWRCDSCKSNIETQKHILWCPAYVDLRAGKNLKEDKDLIGK